jgi:PAS domain S-box-containing protein
MTRRKATPVDRLPEGDTSTGERSVSTLKQALLTREEWLRLAAQGSHLGLWYWNEVTTDLFCDRKTREILGMNLDGEVTLQSFYDTLHPDDLARVREVWRYELESGLPYELEYRVLWRDGTVRWISARGNGFYTKAGKPLYMIGVVFDITERKEADQERLALAQQLTHSARLTTLGTLAASIAHELKQPLTSVGANAAAALRLLQKPAPDITEAMTALEDIIQADRRAGDMVEHFRKLLTRSADSRPPCDLDATIRGVVDLMRREAINRHITLNYQCADGIPLVPADRVHLQQVIMNLIVNALDAVMEPAAIGQAVTVSASHDNAAGVIVTVEDDGPPVSDERFHRMCMPLYTTKPDGLGLGLAICREILAAHGTELRMRRKDAGGMVFSFTLSREGPSLPDSH